MQEKNGAIIACVFVSTQLFRTYARAIFADYVDGTSSIDIEPTTKTNGKITIGAICMSESFGDPSRCSTIRAAHPNPLCSAILFAKKCEATM